MCLLISNSAPNPCWLGAILFDLKVKAPADLAFTVGYIQ